MRTSIVAALALATAFALAASAAPAPAPGPPDPPPDGFDHIIHQGKVEASGGKNPPCKSCHRLDARGAMTRPPDHASCFGACHGSPPPRGARPAALEPAREQVCRACHRPAQLARPGPRGSMRPPPPHADTPDGEFAAMLSHAAHAAVPRGCRACHDVPAEPGRTAPAAAHKSGHPRCARCHAAGTGGAVNMAACTACHTPAVGVRRGPHAERGAQPVTERFSHKQHLARVPRDGDACRGCHAGAASAASDVVPTPKKENCAGCHDGKAAFSLTATECRRCHAPPAAAGTLAVPALDDRDRDRRRGAPFSHAAHAATRCDACHTLESNGAVGAVTRDHAPCSDAGCHAADFAAGAPVTCGVCHVGTEPWRDLHLDPRATGRIQFRVAFSHGAHLGGDGARLAAGCDRCHVGRRGTFELAPGHGACAGSGCHATTGGAAPLFADCASCHQAVARRPGARRWSVRARFTHEGHLTEPGDAARAVACTECHTSLLGGADEAPPAKKTCLRCHDGVIAFKVTGHGCARCHGGGN